MSERMTNEQAAKLISRLRELSQAVADHRMNEFTMSVPAQPHRDADLVLDEAANQLAALRAENGRLLTGGQYMVCDKHPYLLATSAAAAALGCPYCKLRAVEGLAEVWRGDPDDVVGYYKSAIECADDLEAALQQEQSDG